MTTAPPSPTPSSSGIEAGAVELLERAWSSKHGLPGFASAVNHKQIGKRFIWTGVLFLFVGGVEGLLLRIQLARPENTFLGPDAYNQIFTMHGTTMMFLFAVPLIEGLAMYLTPLQLGTRDLPFPRLNAFGYWMYLAGGLLLNWSLVTGSIPDGGWFSYVPLTGPEFSPSRGLDYWLLGVTFVEISGIIGAIELVVAVLKTRAPGMTLGRIPLFAWSVLIMAGMILVAFPFVVTASSLLELERKFGAPFYDAQAGGNPLLWQHLFWIFGHPEVYIILLPATGVISAVVAAHVGRRIVAYPLVVASLIAIAIISFGLWVHHMFAVGLPVMVISLFAVASYFIAVPSGIQVFAWIATIWEGKPKWTAPMWFVAVSLTTFVLGGITGVMVATAPWDLQAHDTFFVVAHFHYVLLGGGVFPVLAGLHHWFPKMTGGMPSETAGKIAAVVLFVGFNLTFFPQHWLGLQGMVRRVYTYDATLGWGGSNMASTIGAFIMAGGFLLYFANLGWAWRAGQPSGSDPWRADSLEWATTSPPPSHNYDVVPVVTGRSPMWDTGAPELASEVLQALEVTGDPWRNRREIVETGVVDADPERIIALPGSSYWPLASATALTVAIVGVLVDWWTMSAVAGLVFVAALASWNEGSRRANERALHQGDPDDPHRLRRQAAHQTFADHAPPGPSMVWWASALAVGALATITGAMVYAYIYLRLGADDWPMAGHAPPGLLVPLVALGLAAAAFVIGPTPRSGRLRAAAGGVLATAAIAAKLSALAGADIAIDVDAYQAIVVTLEAWGAVLLGSVVLLRGATVLLMAPGRHLDTLREADGVFFTGVSVLWLAVWATVHLGARWL